MASYCNIVCFESAPLLRCPPESMYLIYSHLIPFFMISSQYSLPNII